ncbi:hypothetical protein CcI49_13480 [Frankia sp. CcI49]|nr:hypothetical protein CcI49_13480 [Frankia sp. CcI49]
MVPQPADAPTIALRTCTAHAAILCVAGMQMMADATRRHRKPCHRWSSVCRMTIPHRRAPPAARLLRASGAPASLAAADSKVSTTLAGPR